MEWVRAFYEKQQQWADVCSGSVRNVHRRRAALIVCPRRKPPYRILELGCGGGQSAVALAELGHEVVGLDVLPAVIAHAQRLANGVPGGSVSFIETDFYEYRSNRPFDIVCYFDGFGIGSDSDQRHLLELVSSWLRPTGRAFLDVYNPDYWEQQVGNEMSWSDVSRRYGYDRSERRMLDTWWPTGHPEKAVTQTLRCYRPEELEALIEETRLSLVEVTRCAEYDAPGTKSDPESAMQYRAVLRRE